MKNTKLTHHRVSDHRDTARRDFIHCITASEKQSTLQTSREHGAGYKKIRYKG